MKTGKEILILLFVYGTVAIFVILPCYAIGYAWAVVWTSLEVGYDLGLAGFEKFVNSFPWRNPK